jgi:hypothetical protein
METKNMSSNPHSVVHSRQYSDVEKTKEEQPRKSEPGVKGMVSGDGSFGIGSFTFGVPLLQRGCLLRMIIGSFASFLFLVHCPSLFDIDWIGWIKDSVPIQYGQWFDGHHSTLLQRVISATQQNRLPHIVALHKLIQRFISLTAIADRGDRKALSENASPFDCYGEFWKFREH